MAANPLFSSHNRSKGTALSTMSKNSREIRQPPDKRQKTQMNNSCFDQDNLWDDDDDFGITEEEMVDCEIMASQSLNFNQSMNSIIAPNTGAAKNNFYSGFQSGPKSGNVLNAGTSSFPKPVKQTNVINASLVSGKSSHPITSGVSSSRFQSNNSGNKFTFSKSSGYSSGATSTSSTKVQSNVSRPISQVSKANIQDAASTGVTSQRATHGLSATGGGDGKHEFSDVLQKEVEKLRVEVHKLRKEHLGRDGEIKVLRESLHQKDNELYSLKQEKVKMLDEHMRAHNEKEKDFKRERERIATQLQFKERELLEAQTQFRSLERKLQHRNETQSTLGYSENSDSSNRVSPKMRSPKLKRFKPDHSPHGKGFPTSHSFNAVEKTVILPASNVSTSSRGTDTCDLKNDLVTSRFVPDQSEIATCVGKLEISMPKGLVTAPQLVSKLLSKKDDESLLSLLNERLMKFDFQQLKHQKSAITSPTKLKGSQFHKSDALNKEHAIQPVVSEKSHSLAMEALSSLLNTQTANQTESNSVLPNINNKQLLTFSGDTFPSCASHAEVKTKSDGINILPLLKDYLVAFLDCLQNSGIRDKFVKDGDSSSNLVLQESLTKCKLYSETLEKRTLVALKVLKSLICYSTYVAKELVNNNLKTKTGKSPVTMSITSRVVAMETEPEVIVIDDDDDPKPGPSSKLHLNRPSKSKLPVKRSGAETVISEKMESSGNSVIDKNVVECVIDIVLNLTKDRTIDTTLLPIANVGMDVLISIAKSVNKEGLEKYEPVFKMTDFAHLLDSELDVSFLKKMVKLISSLVASNHFVSSLCSQNDDCVLLAVYTLCCHQFKQLPANKALRSLYIEILHFLSLITSYHKGGITLLTESDCQCSVELIKSVITMLNSQLEVYREMKDSEEKNMSYEKWCEQGTHSNTSTKPTRKAKKLTGFLRQGILFLHRLSLHYSVFADHHYEVEHQYVNLICGMRAVYKEMGDISELEMNALYDLWDFDQDDPDFTKEDEERDSSENSKDGDKVAMETD